VTCTYYSSTTLTGLAADERTTDRQMLFVESATNSALSDNSRRHWSLWARLPIRHEFSGKAPAPCSYVYMSVRWFSISVEHLGLVSAAPGAGVPLSPSPSMKRRRDPCAGGDEKWLVRPSRRTIDERSRICFTVAADCNDSAVRVRTKTTLNVRDL